jgi:hypothetical protein
MSRHGDVTFLWADGEYTFRLAVGQVREVEEKCARGVYEIYQATLAGRWHFDWLREIIRLGLIGGGMTPVEALKLVQRYCDERPWLESWDPAVRILAAGLIGPVEDQPLGKKAEAAEHTSPSASPPSMEMAH